MLQLIFHTCCLLIESTKMVKTEFENRFNRENTRTSIPVNKLYFCLVVGFSKKNMIKETIPLCNPLNRFLMKRAGPALASCCWPIIYNFSIITFHAESHV